MLTETMSLDARAETACSVRATTSFPVPCSPVINTFASDGPTRVIASKTGCMAGAVAMNSGQSFRLQQAILGGESLCSLQCAPQFNLCSQYREQALIFPWLLKEIPSAAPHGFNCEFNVGPRRHHDNGNGAVEADDFGRRSRPSCPDVVSRV